VTLTFDLLCTDKFITATVTDVHVCLCRLDDLQKSASTDNPSAVSHRQSPSIVSDVYCDIVATAAAAAAALGEIWGLEPRVEICITNNCYR